jgi:hypothetical protein
MGLILNNTSFVLTGGSFVSSEPILPPPLIGEIFRVVNGGVTLDALIYTKIDGIVGGGIINLTGGEIAYILALSQSLSDSPSTGLYGQIIATDLLITSSVDETPTFTEVVIETTGAGTWTKPVGVTQVIVECWGAGGAGGGATGNPAAGGGGGGGQYSRKYLEYSSPSVGIPYSVGAGGIGTNTTVVSGGDTTWNTTTVVAKGGTGGTPNATTIGVPVNGGLGNVAGSVGDVIYFGENGGVGEVADVAGIIPISGPGGGGAGSAETTQGLGTQGGKEFGGFGGDLIAAGSSVGNSGTLYGGGGGGAVTDVATNRAGGNGGQGLIRILYI